MFIKQMFDMVIAIPLLILLSPLLVFIGFLVCFKIGSPMLFCQVRPGLRSRSFIIYKFRTMTDKRDGKGNLLADGERLIRLGRFLRSTSLDPQITPVK